MTARRIVPLLFLISFILPACRAVPGPDQPGPWGPAHVRLLDPVDSDSPSRDILAVYSRPAASGWRIRLDFLDSLPTLDSDLYLLLDTLPGGSPRLPIQAQAQIDGDLLVCILAAGEIRVLAADGGEVHPFPLQVLRDPNLDSVEISLGASGGLLPVQGFHFQIFVTAPGSPQVVEETAPVHSLGAPVQRLPVLLAFWNSLPAYTPAQALRRWDGAHTGPLGGRHGLGNLLRAARASRTPLVLLDLNNPASLAALDLLDGEGLVRDSARAHLLVLPETLAGWTGMTASLTQSVLQRSAAASRRAAQEFGLSAGAFLYAPTGELPANTAHPVIFYPQPADSGLPQLVTVQRRAGSLLVPIPTPADAVQQAGPGGPALEVRRILSAAALQVNSAPAGTQVLVLGGDLPASRWGIPSQAAPTLHYLASRPWLQVLGPDDLLGGLRPGDEQRPRAVDAAPAGFSDPALLGRLESAPDHPLTQAAWQAYLQLLSPVYPAPAELDALRRAYLPQVHALLSAAEWAAQPFAAAGCQDDPDRDGQAECVLANEEIYAQFENDDGSLFLLFARIDGQVHQIAGPSSLLSAGLSDASSWDPGAGLSADPAVIPGAFAEQPDLPYSPSLQGETLVFSSPNGGARKTYRLIPGGIAFAYQGPAPAGFEIPLLLDPWLRFSPGWAGGYALRQTASGLRWEAASGVSVQVRAEGEGTAAPEWHTFRDALEFLPQAENPDRNYPPGHYVEFPLAVIRVSGMDITVEIQALAVEEFGGRGQATDER